MLISEMYSKNESFCHQYLQEPDYIEEEQNSEEEPMECTLFSQPDIFLTQSCKAN